MYCSYSNAVVNVGMRFVYSWLLRVNICLSTKENLRAFTDSVFYH